MQGVILYLFQLGALTSEVFQLAIIVVVDLTLILFLFFTTFNLLKDFKVDMHSRSIINFKNLNYKILNIKPLNQYLLDN